MNWYRGNIAEAVAHSKAKNAIFVVYVEGKDEATQKLNTLISDEKIRKKLESDDFVAIKIESDSQAYIQFATIYQVVPVPSIFFIGKSGTPLYIGTGILASCDELETKINKVIAESGRDASTASVSPAAAEEVGTQVPVVSTPAPESSIQPSTSNYLKKDNSSMEENVKDSDEMVCDENICYKKSKPEENVGEKVKDRESADLSKDAEIDASTRLTETRQKLEQQRRERMEEKKQMEKEQELRRRREGKEMQNLQQWQREQELKELKETIRREKLEEQAARDRIRAQIAADRAERAQKFGNSGDTTTIKSSSAATTGSMPVQSINSDSSAAPESIRIQFRFATGENSTQIFNCDDPLKTVRDYVRTSLLPGTGIKEFTLAITYPKQEFSNEHDMQTLAELGFFRSAVILVISKDTSATPRAIIARSGGLFNMLSTLVMTILSPVFAIFAYIKNKTTGGDVRAGGNEPINNGSNKRENEERGVHHEVAKRRNLERFGVNDEGANSNINTPSNIKESNESKSYRRYGSSNIHRLSDNRKDSDDENATWNGNSTQQQ